MANRLHLTGEIYGFSQPALGGPFSSVANVFADHAKALAVDGESREVFLGHFIAHEMGHLLLGDAGHGTIAGIMHIPWRTHELELAKKGGLLFLPEQAERIRARLVVRTTSE